jgi:hypothetical protein
MAVGTKRKIWTTRTAWLEPRCFPNSGAAYQHTFGKRRRFQPSPAGTRASVLRHVSLGASGAGYLSCAGALGSATLSCSSTIMAGRVLPAACSSRSGARSARGRLLAGVRRRFGAGLVSDPSRFSGRVSSEALAGTGEGGTRSPSSGSFGAAGEGSDGSGRCGAKPLDAESPRLAAVEGESPPPLAGASSCTSRLGTSSGAGSSISLPLSSSEAEPRSRLRMLSGSTANGRVGRLMATQIGKGKGELRSISSQLVDSRTRPVVHASRRSLEARTERLDVPSHHKI